MAAPANVSRDVLARLHAAIGQIVSSIEVKETLSRQGLEPQSATPEEFAAMIKRDLAQHAKLVKAANLKAD
jgi:tripartite-type tricarboxylate transporter receptor subunit TctC